MIMKHKLCDRPHWLQIEHKKNTRYERKLVVRSAKCHSRVSESIHKGTQDKVKPAGDYLPLSCRNYFPRALQRVVEAQAPGCGLEPDRDPRAMSRWRSMPHKCRNDIAQFEFHLNAPAVQPARGLWSDGRFLCHLRDSPFDRSAVPAEYRWEQKKQAPEVPT